MDVQSETVDVGRDCMDVQGETVWMCKLCGCAGLPETMWICRPVRAFAVHQGDKCPLQMSWLI